MQVKDLPPAIREACIERGHGDDASITPIQAMEEYGAWEIGNGPFTRQLIEAYLQLVTLDAEQKAEARKAKIDELAERSDHQVGELLDAVLEPAEIDAYLKAFDESRAEIVDNYRDLHMQSWIDPAIPRPLSGESTTQLSRRPIPIIRHERDIDPPIRHEGPFDPNSTLGSIMNEATAKIRQQTGVAETETSSTDQGHSNEPAWKLK